jgi:hypothetical protein
VRPAEHSSMAASPPDIWVSSAITANVGAARPSGRYWVCWRCRAQELDPDARGIRVWVLERAAERPEDETWSGMRLRVS